MRVWRISNHADISGIGGKFAEGRWNWLGTEIVYCSDHPSTCMLELLVRFDPSHTPSAYQLLEIEIPDKLKDISSDLPKDWARDVTLTRDIWKTFCDEKTECVLKVPSAMISQASHYLLNPHHVDHSVCKVISKTNSFLDERFYR